ncbi:MAG: alanine--tRNA ligase [Pirellulales bacterium]
MKTDELREKYLEFFASKGCVRRPSDVLVPRWDPSVLFTPAGMNQFKDHFLGRCKLEWTKATTCQKCLRTGDIDNVGRTAYHHTFFEMLGNFSFGDYFKREAINWAWEFLTAKKWLGLDANKLTVTVYLDDDEAAEIWAKDIKLTPDRIARMGEDDNFWPAGAPSNGPDGVCGPCSEIFFHPDGGKEVEIWNLVFTQFNRVGNPPDNLKPLPSKNIDTGMGLERCAAVLQGVTTNYHIDILQPIVEAAAEVCGVKYDPASDNGRRLRRITDHVRACTFAVHENVYPGAKKQEYVIKRLLRRAVLDGRQIGLREPFLYKLVGQVADVMKVPYPELQETRDRVAEGIKTEEEAFFDTIDAGLARTDKIFAELQKSGGEKVAGADAFDMYQTYGFPPELFEQMAAERNLGFDWDGYREGMKKHEEVSGGEQRELFTTGPLVALKKTLGHTEFLGYEQVESPALVKGIVSHDHLCDRLEEIGHDQPIVIVLDRTPFYGESGGQVGDYGTLTAAGMLFEVTDTQRDGDLVLHIGHLRSGKLTLDMPVTATVDTVRRQGIRRAHSATHVLHYALQKHLGSRAQQRGSKVENDSLRFDFTHAKAVTPDELSAIEADVNARLMECAPISWKHIPIAEARTAGAMMLFGEKYPDIVRMVTMGDFSKELCGGTHLDNVGQVGLFRIVHESSVSAGTRRISAITGAAARDYFLKHEAALHDTAAALKLPPGEDVGKLPQRVSALVQEVRDLKKQLAAASKADSASPEQLLDAAETIGGAKVVVSEIPGGNAGSFREMIDLLRRKGSPVAALLASREEGKVTLVAGISRELQERGLDSGKWINSAAALVGGKGGGRADLAQAGGKLPDKLPEALEAARAAAKSMLGG